MDQIYRLATAMQTKFRDYRDDKENSLGRQLDAEIQRLADDIKVKKNPGSIEDRVKQIISLLNNTDGTSVMDNNHVDDLKDRAEAIRDQLRKLA